MPKLTPPDALDLNLSESLLEDLGSGLSAVIVPHGHRIFNQMESIESAMFPETVQIFDVDEREVLFQFLVLIDGGVAHHAMRLSGPGPLAGRPDLLPFFITDLAGFGDQISEEEVVRFYDDRGVDVAHVTSIETNFRIGPNLQPIGSADLAYLTMFRLQEITGIYGTFAHLNQPAIGSLDRVGISWSHVAEREDLATPSIDFDGTREFDHDYTPVFIDGWKDEATKAEVEEFLAPFTPPIVFLDLDPIMRDDYFKSKQA